MEETKGLWGGQANILAHHYLDVRKGRGGCALSGVNVPTLDRHSTDRAGGAVSQQIYENASIDATVSFLSIVMRGGSLFATQCMLHACIHLLLATTTTINYVIRPREKRPSNKLGIWQIRSANATSNEQKSRYYSCVVKSVVFYRQRQLSPSLNAEKCTIFSYLASTGPSRIFSDGISKFLKAKLPSPFKT